MRAARAQPRAPGARTSRGGKDRRRPLELLSSLRALYIIVTGPSLDTSLPDGYHLVTDMVGLWADGWFYISSAGLLVSGVLFFFLLSQYRAAAEAADGVELAGEHGVIDP